MEPKRRLTMQQWKERRQSETLEQEKGKRDGVDGGGGGGNGLHRGRLAESPPYIASDPTPLSPSGSFYGGRYSFNSEIEEQDHNPTPLRNSPLLSTRHVPVENSQLNPSILYEDPLAKSTLDLLKSWALGIEPLTLPQAEDSIRNIYGGAAYPQRWHEISACINECEEEGNPQALNLIEEEQAKLVILPSRSAMTPPLAATPLQTTPPHEYDIRMYSPIQQPILLGASAPRSTYQVPLLNFARIPAYKYEDPFAKSTLDFLRRWALNLESYTLTEAENAIFTIYGGKVSLQKWQPILDALNPRRDESEAHILKLIEVGYRTLILLPGGSVTPPLPPASPVPTFSRPPTPPGSALPVSRPPSPYLYRPSYPQIPLQQTPRTLQEILRNPNLLTHRKGGSRALRACDGKVGAISPDQKFFVTTPNMEVALMPVLDSRVTLRRFNNFGKDDPLLWPQKYNRDVVHLAVIPSPYSFVPLELQFAWYIPAEADFISERSDSIQGLYNLAPTLVISMERMSTFLEVQVDLLPEVEKEGHTLNLVTGLLSLVERLTLPNTTSRLALLLSLFQRVSLELYARLQWIHKWRVREKDTSDHPLDESIIGAFTDSPVTAKLLFRMGIPVWLIRDIREVETTRVDKLVTLLDVQRDMLPLRGQQQSIDVSQADPPHPSVYAGPGGSFTRYDNMAKYVRSYFETNLLGNFNDRIQPSSSTHPSSGTSTEAPPTQTKKGTHPYDLECLDPTLTTPVTITVKLSKSANPGVSKFLEIHSPFVPKLLPPWRIAHENLDAFWPHIRDPELHCVVPELMTFFDTHSNLRIPLLLMWVRIRPLVLWRLGSTGAHAVPLYPNTCWRAMLESLLRTGHNSAQSRKAKRRKVMANVLDDLIQKAQDNGVYIQANNLPTTTPLWKQQPLNEDNLTPHIVQQILWEIQEIAFRFELLHLTMRLSRNGATNNDEATWEETQNLVSGCWPGLIFNPSVENPGLSKASASSHRQPYLLRLFKIMQRWRVPKPYLLERAFPDPKDKDPIQYESDIYVLEEHMASFYARYFLKTYKRPAALPRAL